MTITTSLTNMFTFGTELTSVESQSVSKTSLGVLNTTLTQAQSTPQSISLIATGLMGPIGPAGPQGPEYQGNDLPDFTLIFDNKLI